MHQKKTTILLASHNMNELKDYSEVMMMKSVKLLIKERVKV